jgi:hypothetical protein
MHIKKLLSLACFIVITATLNANDIPDSVWAKAKLIDIQNEQHTRVSSTNYGGYSSVEGGSYNVERLIIETKDMIFEVVPLNGRTTVKLNKGKLDFIVNTPVDYAIEKMKMYLRDSNGQVGEFRIVKKTLKSQ